MQGKTWCVAQTSAPDDALKAFLVEACERYNCKDIMEGGSCYQPANIRNHGSYAQDIGTPTVTDPSFGSCHYP